MLPLRIISTGKALPSRAVPAHELDLELGLRAGESLERSGIHLRHFAGKFESQTRLGAIALGRALNAGSLVAGDIDLLISASGVQEQALPSTACILADHAGVRPGTSAFDVNASCLSFLQALQVAAALIAVGAHRRVAIVSSDLASRGLDFSDHESLIFGDGAAAVIVERGLAGHGVLAHAFRTYPEGRTFCEIRAGGSQRNPSTGCDDKDFLFKMDGKAVFKMAARLLDPFLAELLAMADLTMQDIDWVVPHQASHLGMAHMTKRLGLPATRVVNIYPTHGNQVAASMPTALHELLESGRTKPGDKVLLLGTAAGLSVGGAVLVL